MCGIAGISHPKNDSVQSLAELKSMLSSMNHRGPDFTDTWSEEAVHLGHNRLSIIDLDPRSHQPIHYQDLVMTFNGEVYNYLELREELKLEGYTFTTESDTEVIIAAYKAWGESCVERMMGMWALAIYDRTKKTLFFSRDRFGIKPLYYMNSEKGLFFSSEVKALKETNAWTGEVQNSQVLRGLQLGWVTYEDETYYKDVQLLRAAHNMRWDGKELKIWRYWDIDASKKFEGTKEEAVSKFKELFQRSLDLHLRSDVEVGACLSGGLDSASIVSMISKNYSDVALKSFTIYYEGKDAVDERPWVDKILEKYPQMDPYYNSPKDENVQEALQKVLHHMDFPLAGSSPISQYFVMKLAASHNMKVLLDGQGSDEYLGGYMHSFYRLIGGFFSKLKFRKGINAFTHHTNEQSFGMKKSLDVLAKSVLSSMSSEEQLYNYEFKNYWPYLGKSKIDVSIDLKSPFTGLKAFLYHLLFHSSLPSLLHYEDRNSMAFSIESRVPFLDHRLIEFIFSLPEEWIIYQGRTKYMLREALKEALPQSIYSRTDKKGFVTPGEVKWLRGPLKHLLEKDFADLDMLDMNKVQSLITDYKNGNNKNARLVWRLAMLNEWKTSN